MKVTIKNRFDNSVIFEHESEENTIRKTLELAIKRGAYLPIYCKWNHSIVDGKIKIGCKENTIEEWESFFNSDAIYETKRNTQDFKQIQALFESYKTYLNFLNT